MIQMAKSTTVTMMVVWPRPKSSMSTGTRDDSGALAKILTHMPRSSLAAFTRPMRMPSRIPPTMAIDMPRPKACKEISAASWKLFCWTTLTRATSTPDKGGKTKTTSNWPTISQSPAQISREKTAGMR
jgi:hypothetical protein